MGKDNLISQLAFLVDLESEKNYDANEDFCSDGKRPDCDEEPYNYF